MAVIFFCFLVVYNNNTASNHISDVIKYNKWDTVCKDFSVCRAHSEPSGWLGCFPFLSPLSCACQHSPLTLHSVWWERQAPPKKSLITVFSYVFPDSYNALNWDESAVIPGRTNAGSHHSTCRADLKSNMRNYWTEFVDRHFCPTSVESYVSRLWALTGKHLTRKVSGSEFKKGRRYQRQPCGLPPRCQGSYLIAVPPVTHFIQHDQTIGLLGLLPHQMDAIALDFMGHGASNVICLGCKVQWLLEAGTWPWIESHLHHIPTVELELVT